MAARRFARPGQNAPTADLVERAVAYAKQGHADAVHFLYVRFVDEVGTVVRRIRHGDPDPQDITDTVFARLEREIHQYEPGELPFAQWILRFAGKVARSDMSTSPRHTADHVGGPGPQHDTSLQSSARLREAVRRLPDDQRRVLVLRHIAGLSPKEVADRLGGSEASVRGLEENGRRALHAARGRATPARPD